MSMTPEQEKALENLFHQLTFVENGEGGRLIDNWWNGYIIRMIAATVPELTVDKGAELINLEYNRRYYNKELTPLFKQ